MTDRPFAVDTTDDLFEILRGGERRGLALAETLWRHLGPAPRHHRTLEVGVGAGVVASAVQSDGRWVAGVDLSPVRLRRASRRLMGAAARADARALPFRSGSFDAAYLVWLQLVPDREVTAEVARVLRRGGRLVLVTGPHEVGAGDEVGAVEDRLAALHPWKERPADVALRNASQGLKLVSRGRWALEVDQSPSDAARGLEGRDLARLWALPEDEAGAAIAGATAALRALPDPDRPRRRHIAYPLLVFERA
jgi:SAM-dependent methyltransferase